jgi:hypothetical protein
LMRGSYQGLSSDVRSSREALLTSSPAGVSGKHRGYSLSVAVCAGNKATTGYEPDDQPWSCRTHRAGFSS